MLAISGVLHAQMVEPVKWSVNVTKVSEKQANIVFTANIDPDWHLYSQHNPPGGSRPAVFSYESNDAYRLIGKPLEWPKYIIEYDDFWEKDEYYFKNTVTFTQQIEILKQEKFTVTGEIDAQACIEGRCTDAPYEFSIPIDGTQYTLEDDPSDSLVEDTIPTDTAAIDTASTNPTVSSNDDMDENDIAGSSLWTIFIIAFVSGLIAIFTPCVLPMIPMTVTFFLKGSDNKAKGRRQAFFFGASIIVIFTVLGSGLSIIFGPTLFQWLSTHWLPNIIFFLIFMIFAFSFFGMFEIRMPSGLINKSDQQADKGCLFGPFFMALTLVLVSFSCTVPIIGAVVVMLSNGEFLQPIVAMFGFGLAFAVPFTLFALFPRWLGNLPKS
ncbi:MAG: hypothetical protein C0592_03740, partial [Marinilabiliales bacterium]